jgi:DNA-directed RNA polymerase specialized sigma24 family protein
VSRRLGCLTSGGVKDHERTDHTDSARDARDSVSDSWGRAAAYDAYADGLHTYALGGLRNHEAAAAAVYCTFLAADHHVAYLEDADMLRPWLYAITRYYCRQGKLPRLRLAAGTGAGTKGADGGGGDVGGLDGSADLAESGATVRREAILAGLERSLVAAELASLDWPDTDGLASAHREVLELSVRHGLESRAVGLILSRPAAESFELLSSAWHELERSLAATALLRTTREHCAELAELAEGWTGRLTVQRREPLVAHVDCCSRCQYYLHKVVGTPQAPTILPHVAAPRVLRDRVLGDLLDDSPTMAAEKAAIAVRLARFDRHGFPAAGVVRAAAMAAAPVAPVAAATAPVRKPRSLAALLAGFVASPAADATATAVASAGSRMGNGRPVPTSELGGSVLSDGSGVPAADGRRAASEPADLASSGPRGGDARRRPLPTSESGAVALAASFGAAARTAGSGDGRRGLLSTSELEGAHVSGSAARAGDGRRGPAETSEFGAATSGAGSAASAARAGASFSDSVPRSGSARPAALVGPSSAAGAPAPSVPRTPRASASARRRKSVLRSALTSSAVLGGVGAAGVTAFVMFVPSSSADNKALLTHEPGGPVAPGADAPTANAVGGVGVVPVAGKPGAPAESSARSGAQIVAAVVTQGGDPGALPPVVNAGYPVPPAGGASQQVMPLPGPLPTAPTPGAPQGVLTVSVNQRSNNPGEVTVTLRNSGDAPVAWTATADAPFLTLSQSSGVLPAGGQQVVKITVAQNAAPPTGWQAHVRFDPSGATVTLSGSGSGSGGNGGPSTSPSTTPSGTPSTQPSSSSPSGSPSTSPGGQPSGTPSSSPSSQPSTTPSSSPSNSPSSSPSSAPSGTPSSAPSSTPPPSTPASSPSSPPSSWPKSTPASTSAATPSSPHSPSSSGMTPHAPKPTP